jgi:hypothetical protein
MSRPERLWRPKKYNRLQECIAVRLVRFNSMRLLDMGTGSIITIQATSQCRLRKRTGYHSRADPWRCKQAKMRNDQVHSPLHRQPC